MRLRTLGPGIIDPIARVLQVFYAPPVLIAILLIAAAAHGWLYGVLGVRTAFARHWKRPVDCPSS
jgi:hypothetical protein